jgi:hypothetical protein
MTKQLWIVYGSTGEYSDRDEWNVAVVDSEADAQTLVTLLQQQYLSIPQALRDDRWKHEDKIKAIMSLDPGFRMDYTGTCYGYGCAPHLSSFDIDHLPRTPQGCEAPHE